MVKAVQQLESKQAALRERLDQVISDKARTEIEAELQRVDGLLAALRK